MASLRSTPALLLLAYILIVSEAIMPFVYQHTMGSPFDKNNLGNLLALDIYTLTVFFVVPFIVCKYLYKESLKDMVLTLPEDKTKTIILSTFAIIILVPFIYFFTQQPEFHSYAFQQMNAATFTFVHLTFLPIYYFAEEYFFRGFLFITLWRKVKWHSFWITALYFGFGHVGKPLIEMAFSVPASTVLDYLTLKTNSIYPAVFVHFILGIVLNGLIAYHLFYGL